MAMIIPSMIWDTLPISLDLILERIVDDPIQETAEDEKSLPVEIAASECQVATESEVTPCEPSTSMEIETKDIETKDSTANSEIIKNLSPSPPPVAVEDVIISEPSTGDASEFFYDFQPENFHAEQVR